MERIEYLIAKLVAYGCKTGLISPLDTRYVVNRLLELYGLDAYPQEMPTFEVCEEDLEELLAGLLDYAWEKGLMVDNTVTYRDLFDTRLMGTLVARPSEVVRTFFQAYQQSPEAATAYFYKLSCDSNYIRRYRVKRDMKWKTKTPYGEIDITINLSKPEKDPKAIAAAKEKAKKEEEAKAAEEAARLAAENGEVPEADAPGKCVVTLNKVNPPGVLASGTVTFSGGSTADWYVDQTGRPGLGNLKGDQPTQQEAEEFMMELQKILR